MNKTRENLLRSIFVLVVVLGVVSGGIVFFNPNFQVSPSESPTAFVSSPIAQQKPVPSAGTILAISAGEDRVVQVGAKVLLEAIVPAGRANYFSWELVSPTGEKTTLVGRKTVFTLPKGKEGNYFATLSANTKDGFDKSTIVITALPQKEYIKYLQELAAARAEGKTASLKLASGKLSSQLPKPRILLVYPNPAVESGTLRFLGDASSPNGQIVSYEWVVGDTVVSTKKSFTALNVVPGTYTFTLVAKDVKGAVGKATKVVTVLPADKAEEAPQSDEGISLWEI